jgi:hypothetical protein
VSGTPDILNISWVNCFVNGFYEQKTKVEIIKANTPTGFMGNIKGASITKFSKPPRVNYYKNSNPQLNLLFTTF